MSRQLSEPRDAEPPRVAYVCGFLFWREEVLLVRKTRPAWQAGLLNGVGGHVEGGETWARAMRREFWEETGLDVSENLTETAPIWHRFVSEVGPDYVVHFFKARALPTDPRPAVPAANDSGEELKWVNLHDLEENQLAGSANELRMVGNLHWLLPMATDWRGTAGTLYTAARIQERPSW